MMAETGKKISDDTLVIRIVSASVMVPAGLVVVWSGGPVLMLACALVGVAMWFEYWQVTSGEPTRRLVWHLGAVCILAQCLVLQCMPDYAGLIIAGIMITVLAALFLGRQRNPLWQFLGFVLVSAAVLSLIFVRGQSEIGLTLTVTIMVCVWATDIAAYFAGRGFGGPQLSPTGSPNKTWSGAAGAVICAALIGVFLAGLTGASALSWFLFASLLSIVAQLGDLAQSFWKRRYGVKDSGKLIPGHGGVLDRLDSFSATLICVSLMLLFIPDLPYAYLGLEAA